MPRNRKGLLFAALIALFVLVSSSGVAVAKSVATQREQASTAVKLKHLRKKEHKSRSVINFWHNKGRWALHLRHENCWQLKGYKGRKVCMHARRSLRHHKRRLARVQARIEKLEGPSWCSGLSGNRQLGCQMAADYWASSSQWYALEELWTKESHWHEYANNPTSDACGIPQAMNNCSYGYDPGTQISWGLNYIRSRYGSPASALSAFYSRSPSWY
ncbi:MAG TPA: hypothetical protein VFW52_00135 [Candidatus Saccharimonadales bacterium]|nr:hypothetical protein [Candidatus Saccharimonadales bacterium]